MGKASRPASRKSWSSPTSRGSMALQRNRPFSSRDAPMWSSSMDRQAMRFRAVPLREKPGQESVLFCILSDLTFELFPLYRFRGIVFNHFPFLREKRPPRTIRYREVFCCYLLTTAG